ncbi:basement membrane-specific heparan sulfate proteoglycan core protein-like isoform X4 [Mytilus galloprovincialis]|uniref:basement membrane-specific heparan sulfate proteoglycan core protein-like isoform X4 n=1 Tax=Mytilus galloprovincialis TaxID=29158 RepID=UPI003F7B3C79
MTMYSSSKILFLRNCRTLLISLILLNGILLSTSESEKDFEFLDEELSLHKVEKRSVTDDEDFLNDESGSTPEGSGDTDEKVSYRVVYRVDVNFTDILYTQELSNRDSNEFKTLAEKIQNVLTPLYINVPGTQEVVVVQFQPGSLLTTFDLTSRGYYDEPVLRQTIEKPLNDGRVGQYRASPIGFAFRSFSDGRTCPDFVGRDPSRLPRSGDNRANLLINNIFPCRGYVVAWQYYRIVPRYTGYVGVWRQINDLQFRLIGKTELPIANEGNQTVFVDPPIAVEKGDFIGIFYPKLAEEGVVASATPAEDAVDFRELYQNYYAKIYNEDASPGSIVNLNGTDFQDTKATFALKAIMDYTGIDGSVTPSRCADNQFRCDDGDCVDGRFKCDGQIDCNDESDELNCPAVICNTDEFRCNNKQQCVPKVFVCNRQFDCADDSDEDNCPYDQCSSSEFRCDDGSCISVNSVCNGRSDCADRSDERGCPEGCRLGQFECRNGQCIESLLRCNDQFDCDDLSDEEECNVAPPCPEGLYRCDDGQCVSPDARCNGIVQCRDRSDEANCACRPDEFRCRSGQCIPNSRKCDSTPDCQDRSDEEDCPVKPVCPEGMFTCADNQCIPQARRCDNRQDCRDNTDESVATCGVIVTSLKITNKELVLNEGETAVFDCVVEANTAVKIHWTRGSQFQDNMDIPSKAVIDRGRLTIPNLVLADADTYICSVPTSPRATPDRASLLVIPACEPNQFRCRDGTCITDTYRCDGYADCNDRSDEENCPGGPCRTGQYVCDDGSCARQGSGCNGRTECRDGSDEFPKYCGCPSLRQFQCRDGTKCIDAMQECDGITDCTDRSDEHSRCVSTCRPDEFRCSDGTCINLVKECDGVRDCVDNSDENNCPTLNCRADQFTCTQQFQCIPATRKCDGFADCSDRTDEEGCACKPNEFRCSNGQCIDNRRQCDRNRDCLDNSDEEGCGCQPNEFTCRSGDCIPADRRCDRRSDCRDGSDELNCPSQQVTISITPREMTLRVGSQAYFECTISPADTPLEWYRNGNIDIQPKATVERGRLIIPNLDITDAGDYICSGIYNDRTYTESARLVVRQITVPTTPAPVGPCGVGQATCRNGQCIPIDYRCDGDKDCEDNSDEDSCTASAICEPNEFRCRNDRCAMKIWRCDGDDDCGDNSDEEDCPTRKPGDPCDTIEFQCMSGDQCVPGSYQCDGEIDCQDRSDEIGCSPPVINLPPVSKIDVELGGSFTIICEAVGTPTPLIVWRLNWGNIPTGPRVFTSSNAGRGNLTITDARVEDSGAYTCEAINTRGSIFATPDAIIIVRRYPAGLCQQPYFNVEASVTGDCVRCFCFGHSDECYSSNLQISQINLVGEMKLLDTNSSRTVETAYVQQLPSLRGAQVPRFDRLSPNMYYYWSLPSEFLSERLTSYGGKLQYNVYYEIAGGSQYPTQQSDVMITGNGITLYHRTSTQFRPRGENSVSVAFLPNEWTREDQPKRGDTPVREYASREDLMMVLENVESIKIRSQYDARQTLTRVNDVILTTGVQQDTGLGRAVYVEDCVCPAGHTGLSCQDCAVGYHRVRNGPYLGNCVRCRCNGHSNDCDPVTGQCRSCQHNTEGTNCENCARGYYGDATQGTPNDCNTCPCPLTESTNQFSPTCEIDRRDGQVTCTACAQGYEGRRCERCARGYVGNPQIVGDYCRISDERCDSRGSLSQLPDSVTRQCTCKTNVYGRNCDQCKQNTFYLSVNNPYGCVSCFCMGVTQQCTSTFWHRAQIGASFTRDRQGFSLVDIAQRQEPTTDGFTVNSNVRELTYRRFNTLPQRVYYWSLPQRFLGDKVTSYGGNLNFVISYRPGLDTSPQDTAAPLVEISGNDITLVYKDKTAPTSNTPAVYKVPLYEQFWTRPDGEPATREFLLMALADVSALLIRATFTRDTDSASIRDVIMDIAEDRDTRLDRAYAVEQCACPTGYKGLSCEDCDSGYTRTGGGLYLGLCEPCQCNRHSSECDPETGTCKNCQHNTEGDMCEKCAPGFYGDARGGSPTSCQPCPCPLTESPNQFSPVCELSSDGQVTCTACPAGHTGRRCESCIQGYTGNPLRPGDYCKIGPVGPDCNCDSRGTVPNTQCDPNNLQCTCKSYVRGLRCSSCKDGYFYLDQSNQQGCLACWCNGLTNQCSSSSYYRDELRPQLGSDGSHNFALTNRRLSNTITDGFELDVTRREVKFARLDSVQKERESLYFSLPPKFRGNKVESYGGYLRFTLETHVAQDAGGTFRDVDIEIITSGQRERMYHLFNPAVKMYEDNLYEILLRESTFQLSDGSTPTREAFLRILSDIEAILIRATYHSITSYTSLRDLRMDTAVPEVTNLGRAPMVESCRCPEGYRGLSCEECAVGYLKDTNNRCIRCSCNGHASACDPATGVCLNCQDNTEGERCERCATGYYGDSTTGTPNDCRPCPCPLTVPSNQFSRSCYLESDGLVTCDRCPPGYIGRKCERCDTDRGYTGNPTEVGGRCQRDEVLKPVVTVNPTELEDTVGQTIVFQCNVQGPGPFNVIWSRIDGQGLPNRAQVGPRYSLTIRDVQETDAGRYVCTATNVHGSNRQYVNLIVLGKQQPIRVYIEPPKERSVDQGQSVRFVCVAQGEMQIWRTGRIQSNYILSWSKVGGLMPNKAIDQNGVLVIPNVRPEDGGTYECTGSDMFNMDTDRATLVVSAQQVQPTVRIEPTFQTVNEFETAEFRCVTTGRPAPTVEWRRGTGTMNPSAVISGGVLRIPAALRSDEAQYFCKASNVAGTTEVRTILYVKSNPRPPTDITVIVRQVAIIATIGSTEQLICYIDDNSVRPTLIWSRNGGLPSGSAQENGVLTLNNIQPSFAGSYVCTGITPNGDRGTGTTTLTVRPEIETTVPTATVTPDRTTIAQGTTGTIRCSVTGTPQPKITWSKSRGELTSRHQVVGEMLRITNAQVEDRGVYICRAENTAGLGQGWAIVEVERRAKPKLDIYPAISQTIKTGESALFQCRVMGGDPPPTVTWSRAGGEPMLSTIDTMENGVIMFKGVTGEEAGGYICTATNEMGSVTATATLIIQGPPRIVISPSKKVFAVIGQRVSLECTGEGDPIPTVQWKYERAPDRGDVPTPVEGALSQGSATLTLNAVSRSDSGNYYCTANNVAGSVTETVQLEVQESGQPSRETGVTIRGPGQRTVREGETVTIECDTTGIRNAVVRWRKRDGLMPPNHSVRGGTLTIPNFRSVYSGEYICSASSPVKNYETSVFIIVTVTPSLTISPARVEARAGGTVQLRCRPQGSGPFNIEWLKVDGVLNPSATQTRDGLLEIRQVTAADTGRYRCLATGSSGSSDGFAIVSVIVPPTITLSQREARPYLGQLMELRCQASGNPPPSITWEKENGVLPRDHTVNNGVLQIFNVRQEDSGRYICQAASQAGVDREYVTLTVQGRNTGTGTGPIRIDTQTVNIGERVEMECVVTGTPIPTVTWSRIGEPLPETSTVNDVFLVIPNVRIEDAGTYVCTAQNLRGTIQQRVNLFVKARPIISGSQADSMTAALGSKASMSCEAVGYPQPDITWYRKDGQMPSEYTVEKDGRLTIPKVNPDDAGMYVCSAGNELGKIEQPMELVVGDLVPYFPQNPVSYITYPPMNDVYLDFDILLRLKPEATDGLVLYNGNDDFQRGGGDYVCFGLREGYPEFTFDVGSGPAIIQGNETLDLNQWHTVRLERNRKAGTLTVNEKQKYIGETPGRFQGLDLTQDMYLGGVPDYSKIPQPARYTTGFVGAISQVERNGDNLNLGADAVTLEGIEMYDACQNRPCMNGARCTPANSGDGFRCVCPQGFTGERCDQQGQRCYPGACGPAGRCRNLPNGFTCICPMESSGPGCLTVGRINIPRFNKTSFAAYAAVQGAKFEMKIELEFKPHSLENGIVLYSAQSNDGIGDYVSLALRNGYLEFRYNTGSGPAVLSSRRRLTVNEWVKVVASKQGQEGTLVVNDEEPVKAASPGTTIGLDLRTMLYIGGTDSDNKLPQNLGITDGLVGCVAEVTINSKQVDLIGSAVETYNVQDCGERNICNRRPCLNGGTCERLSSLEYRCVCPTKFTGKNCETQINVCITKQPCQNNAPCSITADGYRCDCPLGYIGVHCEGTTPLGEKITVTGDGFLEFDKSFLTQTENKQIVKVTIRTTEPNGLIFYQGQASPAGGISRSKDYVSVGLKDGFIEYSYDLGSGPAVIRSLQKVNDGYGHTIEVTRLGRQGTLKIDDKQETVVEGTSQGILQMLNAGSNLYIGGVPSVETMTSNRYKETFSGCIYDIYFMDKGPLRAPEDAVRGFNVRPCS